MSPTCSRWFDGERFCIQSHLIKEEYPPLSNEEIEFRLNEEGRDDGKTYERLPSKKGWVRGLVATAVVGVGTLTYLYPMEMLWGASFLIAAPLIGVGTYLGLAAMIGKRVYDRVAAVAVPFVMSNLDTKMARTRRELLKSIRGRVIDVGCATGCYLRYYEERHEDIDEVVMLEPNLGMHKALRDAIDRHTNIARKCRISAEFLENQERGDGFDWVVLGNVMCEIPDPKAALVEVNRLLTKGGRVYFVEHIAHPHGSFGARLQNLLHPIWFLLSGGCNCNRRSLDMLKQTDWSLIYWLHPFQYFPGPFVSGLAVKKDY
mmetsp:Transcript_41021/g.64047  ORF Transcript_41021/g.64047 Transcript_41021/m.64047 type:complete len:317 (-) Transcript_41021:351-1301(-)